jgi:hypothetical protein
MGIKFIKIATIEVNLSITCLTSRQRLWEGVGTGFNIET